MEAAGGSSGPPLQNERYKLCRILCERRNGWTLRSFCRGQYAAVCTQTWRLGYQNNRCVSPYAEWSERVLQETGCCVDSVLRTKGKSEVPEADAPTRGWCFKHCEDSLDREREFVQKEMWDLCKQHLT
mmetsp:Transcript_79860/g.171154  ORF Transcript_79860/g.171154 Transcript_79860/m.171154 type:complete len:128 (-) Transcript_79860:122-505(-)